MFQFNDADLLAHLDQLIEQRIPAQVDRGLAKQASIAEAEMHATTAHGDITGATRASYRAFVIGGPHTGSAEAASGYAAAEAAISGHANPHGGHALSDDSGVTLGADDRGVLMTSFTDYIDRLVIDNAGQRDALTPTLQRNAQLFTQAVAGEPL